MMYKHFEGDAGNDGVRVIAMPPTANTRTERGGGVADNNQLIKAYISRVRNVVHKYERTSKIMKNPLNLSKASATNINT